MLLLRQLYLSHMEARGFQEALQAAQLMIELATKRIQSIATPV